MNSSELERLLKKHGCKIVAHRGKGGHVTAIRGDKMTILPRHGANKELKTGLVNAILRDLGIK